MTVSLIVAASAGGVLSTSSPLPTDGLPEWFASPDGVRFPLRDGPEDADRADGPFPVTVGRWAAVHSVACRCDGRGIVPGPIGGRAVKCPAPGGAIVEHLEVPGPSHHADECYEDGMEDTLAGPQYYERGCHQGAAPDSWHTPVASVEVLDVPIPCERPEDSWQGVTTSWSKPAVWWVPSAETAAELAKAVTA